MTIFVIEKKKNKGKKQKPVKERVAYQGFGTILWAFVPSQLNFAFDFSEWFTNK